VTDEKWQTIVNQLKETYTILDEGREDLEDRPGSREFFCFVGPGDQKMQIERLSYPPVTGKKTRGGSRVGAASSVEYEYSETDIVHRIVLYRWDDATQEWEEVRGGADAYVV
jgi:hypothetical protein